MREIVIRTMQPEDVPAVCDVDRQCFTLHWSRETFEGEIESVVGYYRVAEREGEVVGYLGSHVILEDAHINTLGVRPDQRRQGIGEALLLDFLRYAVQQGGRRITLEVRAGNEAAIALYQKYGFRPVARRKGYYSDNHEDALVLWVEDTTRAAFRSIIDKKCVY